MLQFFMSIVHCVMRRQNCDKGKIFFFRKRSKIFETKILSRKNFRSKKCQNFDQKLKNSIFAKIRCEKIVQGEHYARDNNSHQPLSPLSLSLSPLTRWLKLCQTFFLSPSSRNRQKATNLTVAELFRPKRIKNKC